MVNMQGLKVLERDGTTFVSLPRELWRPAGTCSCPTCKARDTKEAYWDTMAIAKGKTWTVHYPELHS